MSRHGLILPAANSSAPLAMPPVPPILPTKQLASYPDERAIPIVVLYHLVIATLVALPYVRWRTQSHAAERRAD